MIRRKMAAALAIAVMISLMPVHAFAAEDASSSAQSTQTTQSTQSTAAQPAAAPAKFTGWKTINGAKYWADSNGNIAKSPRYIKGTRTVSKKVKYYYNKKKKKWQTKKIKRAKTKYVNKKVKVTGTYLYMFGTDGKLITTKGLFKYNGKEYYGLGGGILKTKWAAIGKNAVYFNPKNSKTGTAGSMAKDCTIGHLKVPKNGRLPEAYALGVKQLDKSGWTLKDAYKYSYKLKYRNRGFRRDTTEEYAIRGFKKGNGNCYVMASTFFVMAKLLGYDVTRVAGKVAYRYPHSWTVIKENGKEHVYDPNFKNETGRSGWKIRYGKKGTWKYTNYRKVKSVY